MIFALSFKDKFSPLNPAPASQPQLTGLGNYNEKTGSVNVNKQKPIGWVKVEIDFTPETNVFSTN